MPTLYLASKNLHKASEIQTILGSDWTVQTCQSLSASISWNETATTFRGNALIKAQALAGFTDESIIADDSGLEVEVLNGSPGVYSARYAGAEASDSDNLNKLLKVLRGIPLEQRRARFVCVLCFIDKAKNIHFFEGSCSGYIHEEPRGVGGFGYDSIFVPDGFNLSFAELNADQKNLISHRGQALRAFEDLIKLSNSFLKCPPEPSSR